MRAPGETVLNYKETNMHRLQTHHLDSSRLLNRTADGGRKLPWQPEGNQWRLRSGAPIGQRQPAASAYNSYTTHDYSKHGRVAKPFSQHRGGTGEARLISQRMNSFQKNLIQRLFCDRLSKDEVYGDRNYNKNEGKNEQVFDETKDTVCPNLYLPSIFS